MQIDSVATPFGRRPMTHAMLRAQRDTASVEAAQAVDKWDVLRDVCECKAALGLSDRAISVLHALLSFYPGNELSQANGLILFPSNAQVAARAHGIAPATLRRHIAALVNADLLHRADSPNGKRYARRAASGEITAAFGLNIAPLISRALELRSLAAQGLARKEMLKAAKERLTLLRRDVVKLIAMGVSSEIAGDWETFSGRYKEIVTQIPRVAETKTTIPVIQELHALRESVINSLENNRNTGILSGNESQIERHIQVTNPDSNIESERAKESLKKAQSKFTTITHHSAKRSDAGEIPCDPHPDDQHDDFNGGEASRPAFSLTSILGICGEIVPYGPGGRIKSWHDLLSASLVVRSMLDISPTAFSEACRVMGPECAATVIACILERSPHIQSAGGYIRNLTRRAERGEFAVGQMLMALARARSVRH